MVRAAADDADGAIRHLEHAIAIATESGRTSARCEALARLALVAAALASGEPADPRAEVAERSATQVKELLPLLPGHASWGAQADAALATLALHRGDVEAAATAAGAAIQALQNGLHEDTSLDILIPAARAVFAGAPPEVQGFMRNHLRSTLTRIAQGTADESIRVRWLRGPIGRQLIELADVDESVAGAVVGPAATDDSQPELDDAERRLLQLLTEGRTNAEIATDLDLGETEVAQRLVRLQARLGASSRAEATSLAFRGLAAVGSR